jgi:hypothetical protein
MKRKKPDDFESKQSTLDPHRAEEQRNAAQEVVDRLRSRGVAVTAGEPLETLGDLLEAVERFEKAVEAHGGDLMVDDLKSSKPDDRHFVLPKRNKGEALRAYVGRIEDATALLRKHPRHAD